MMFSRLSVFLVVSLAVQKLLSLMQSHRFRVSLASVALADVSVTVLLRMMCELVLPTFSSRVSLDPRDALCSPSTVLSWLLCTGSAEGPASVVGT